MHRRVLLAVSALVLALVLLPVLLARHATPTAQAQPAGQRRAHQLREEHLHLRVRHNGVDYTVRISIVLDDDGSGAYPQRAAEAKTRVKDRFPGAVEVQEQTLDRTTQPYTLEGFWWPAHTTSWAYNPAGKPTYLTNDATVIAASANVWNNAGGADWRFSGGGTTTRGTGACYNSLDGFNTVGWYPWGDGATLAVTCSWFNPSTGQAVEFDMEVDPTWPWTTSTSGVQIDLQSVVAHEFGHALGLGHTTVCPGSLMCPTYAPGTILRTPQADDINGLIALYGSTPTPTATATASATPTLTPTPTGTAAAKAELTSPPPGTTLPGSTVTFQWSAGSGAQEYWLWVGTTPGGYNLYTASQGLNQSVTISGLPTNGLPIYVRLWTKLAGAWQYNDYQYTAASGGQ